MKRFLPLLLLLLGTMCAQAQVRLITQLSYAVDNGSFTDVDVVDGATVSWADVVATLGLPDGLHRLHVRVTDDLGRVGVVSDGYFGTISNTFTGQIRVITQLSYQIDNGLFTDVDVPDGSTVSWADVLQTTGLSDGLHQVRVRGTDDLGRTGVVTAGFFGTISNSFTGYTRVITQLSYQIDNGAFTDVDVPDGATVNWADVLPTTGLPDGLHQVRVRGTDDLGRIGVVTAGFFGTISNNFTGQIRLVTYMDYRLDGGSWTTIDNADAPLVNFAQILATNGLAVGLHSLDLRSADDASRIGQPVRALFIVTSPIVQGQPRTLSAAEFFVNADPGVGSGIAIHLPQDGVWDEGQEQADTVITGLPIGLHRVGFHFRDDVGRWSAAVWDSIVVGPVLVIRPSGNSVILDWQSGPGVTQFKIYRALTSNGTYALIDSTVNTTYTDVGITGSQLKSFYQVRFETNGFSPFRMPDAVPARE